jgi:diguanylate cyclase (GGDEF)-like protein/PAS domain S-box-containing protein
MAQWASAGYFLFIPAAIISLLPFHEFMYYAIHRQGLWVKPMATAHARLIMAGVVIYIASLALSLVYLRSRTAHPNMRGRLTGILWATIALLLSDAIFGVVLPGNNIPWLPPFPHLVGLAVWAVIVRMTVRRYMVVPSRVERYYRLFEQNPATMVLTDSNGVIIDLNESAVELLGSPRHLSDILPKERRVDDWAEIQQSLSHDTRIHRADQHITGLLDNLRVVNMDAESMFLGDRAYWAFLLHDITSLRARQDLVEQMALKDPLTDLGNARAFHQAFETLVTEPAESAAILFLDLDNFKQINDSLGHFVGDLVIKEIGRRLKNLFRPEDMVTRFGGDEFVVLLRTVSARHPTDILERVMKEFAAPVVVDGTPPLTIRSSIGLSRFPEDGSDPDLVLRRADQAMYDAKRAGKNRYRIFEAPQEASS